MEVIGRTDQSLARLRERMSGRKSHVKLLPQFHIKKVNIMKKGVKTGFCVDAGSLQPAQYTYDTHTLGQGHTRVKCIRDD